MISLLSELQGLGYIAVAFIFLLLAKKMQDRVVQSKFNADHEIKENSNLAVGLRRGGLYLAVAISLYGALSGPSRDFLPGLTLLAIDGIFILIALSIAKITSDKIILPHVCNNTEVGKGNVAVGLTEMGLYLATGLIAAGSFSGASPSLLSGIASAVVFLFLGQIVLIIGAKLVEVITAFNIHDQVAKGNTSAGILFGGSLLILGVLLNQAIAGDSLGWGLDLLGFGISAIKGFLGLIIFKWAADWFFLPNTTVAIEVERDHNDSAMVVTVSVMLSIAILVVAAVL
jgi:uncharacterized membrane protein YjfL (UPF0719 family)